MRRERKIPHWGSLFVFLLLLAIGWINLFSTASEGEPFTWDWNLSYIKQLVWIAIALLVGISVFFVETRTILFFSYILYGFSLLLLILTLVLGTTVHGAKSWIDLGGLRLQPSEFAKYTTALAVAKRCSVPTFSLKRKQDFIEVLLIIAIPMILIILQGDTGSALVFLSFVFPLFREGLSFAIVIPGLIFIVLTVLALLINKWYLTGALIALGLLFYSWLKGKKRWIGLLFALVLSGYVFSVDFVMHHVLKPYQRRRIEILLNPDIDPLGASWNVTQSKIAIGSGGLWGKGFRQGTQTRFDFVPKQETDFIFCTVGEEFGWIGTSLVLFLYFIFLWQIATMAENAKTTYARVFGYSVLGIYFFHIAVNIGMTIGVVPVIGIPLPFFSYGGSAMLSFTLMYATIQNLYANRINVIA